MRQDQLLADISRHRAIAHVDAINDRIRTGGSVGRDDAFFLDQILAAVQGIFLAEIRERQQRIPGLDTGELGYTAVWGGELTPGCRGCLDHGFDAIRSADSCNLRCKFCYYYGQEDQGARLLPGQFAVRERVASGTDIKLMLKKAVQGPGGIQGIAWVWFEPFTDFDKHPDIVRWIRDLGVHQHMYTNGTLCTPDNMRALADAGLNEIRFNLAASMCADKVLEQLSVAVDLFEFVCIESPMYREYFDRFVSRRQAILATGVKHIHCAELHLDDNNLPNYRDEALYQYKGGYISPMSSRRLTYDLLDLAVAEGWKDVVIHDCSNEVKFARGVSDRVFGAIQYRAEAGMPLWWFRKALIDHDITAH